MSFSSKLKELRKERGITQKQLAEIANYFNVPITYFMDESPKLPGKEETLVQRLIDLSIEDKLDWVKYSDGGDAGQLDDEDYVALAYMIAAKGIKKDSIDFSNSYVYSHWSSYFFLIRFVGRSTASTLLSGKVYVDHNQPTDGRVVKIEEKQIPGMLEKLYSIITGDLDIMEGILIDELIDDLLEVRSPKQITDESVFSETDKYPFDM